MAKPVLITKVDQSGAYAGGDIVGGDKHVHLPPTRGHVELLMDRLAHEMDTKAEVRETIEQLQFYHDTISLDGIVGLDAKLTKAGRQSEILIAWRKKEQFVKLLDRYSLYGSAQKIFAYVLAKAEHEFNSHVYPQIPSSDIATVNELVTTRIVEPIVKECGIGPMDITHSVVMGMVYWLADQCFVRWHS